MALCINLTANKRNAELVCESDGLPLLVARAFQHQDPLLMKMVRNISQQEGQTKVLFLVSTAAGRTYCALSPSLPGICCIWRGV